MIIFILQGMYDTKYPNEFGLEEQAHSPNMIIIRIIGIICVHLCHSFLSYNLWDTFDDSWA